MTNTTKVCKKTKQFFIVPSAMKYHDNCTFTKIEKGSHANPELNARDTFLFLSDILNLYSSKDDALNAWKDFPDTQKNLFQNNNVDNSALLFSHFPKIQLPNGSIVDPNENQKKEIEKFRKGQKLERGYLIIFENSLAFMSQKGDLLKIIFPQESVLSSKSCNPVKKWKTLKNDNVTLACLSEKEEAIKGSYKFDIKTNILTYQNSRIEGKTMTSKISTVTCGVHDWKWDSWQQPNLSLTELGMIQKISAINLEIAKQSNKRRVFVLPSQLNAAEYPDHKDSAIVTDVQDYIYDPTGGPRGQLAGDPSVAQFIIDNAANKNNQDGINNLRCMEMKGMKIKNGYLIPSKTPDVELFKKEIHKMTILGTEDVSVTGIVSGGYDKFAVFKTMPHKVDLIYASAMPLGKYSVPVNDQTKALANQVLLGQYTCAMKWAVQRKNCELYLMPLGGGVFGNDLSKIKQAIAASFDVMKEELKQSNVEIFLIAYSANKKECEMFK